MVVSLLLLFTQTAWANKCIINGPPQQFSQAFLEAKKRLLDDSVCSFSLEDCKVLQQQDHFNEKAGSEAAVMAAVSQINLGMMADSNDEASRQVNESIALAVRQVAQPDHTAEEEAENYKKVIEDIKEEFEGVAEVLQAPVIEATTEAVLSEVIDKEGNQEFAKITTESISKAVQLTLRDDIFGPEIASFLSGQAGKEMGYKYAYIKNTERIFNDMLNSTNDVMSEKLTDKVIELLSKNQTLIKSKAKAIRSSVQAAASTAISKAAANPKAIVASLAIMQVNKQSLIPKSGAIFQSKKSIAADKLMSRIKLSKGFLSGSMRLSSSFVIGGFLSVGLGLTQNYLAEDAVYSESCDELNNGENIKQNANHYKNVNQPKYFGLHQLVNKDGKKIKECAPILAPTNSLLDFFLSTDEQILNELTGNVVKTGPDIESIDKYYKPDYLCQNILDLEVKSKEFLDTKVKFSCPPVGQKAIDFHFSKTTKESPSLFYDALGPHMRIEFDKELSDTQSSFEASPVRGSFISPNRTFDNYKIGENVTPISYFNINQDSAVKGEFISNMCAPRERNICRGDGSSARGRTSSLQKFYSYCHADKQCSGLRGKRVNSSKIYEESSSRENLIVKKSNKRNVLTQVKSIKDHFPLLSKYIAIGQQCCSADNSQVDRSICKQYRQERVGPILEESTDTNNNDNSGN